jgi:deoxyribodipyrimidine photo-lyase
VRTFVPELGALPASDIHDPSRAPTDVLAQAEVAMDRSSPAPIIDHAWARARALAALAAIR